MIPCRNTKIVEEGLELLTRAYRDKPAIRGILALFLKQAQELENVQWDVITKRLIGTVHVPVPVADDGCCTCDPDLAGADPDVTVSLDGSGVQLDPIGALVGEARNGRSDAEFLVAIRARIKVNKSDGLAEDIVQIAALAMPVGVTSEYSEPAEATWLVRAFGFTGAATLARLFSAARMGGVRGLLEYSSYTLESSFRFASFYGASTGDTRGYESFYGGSHEARYIGVLETRP